MQSFRRYLMIENRSWRSKLVMGLLLTLSLLIGTGAGTSAIAASSLPKFEVVGQDKTVLSVVVPHNTTVEQLKALIFQFRAARKSNSLSTMIPATTSGGQFGDYAIVWIFVFTERDWASTDKLHRFINSSANSATDREYDKTFARHIKAEYLYSNLEEHGSLGYDDGAARSPIYKKLF
jgi:hypothetical protein